MQIHILNVNRILCNTMPHEEIDTDTAQLGRADDGAIADRRLRGVCREAGCLESQAKEDTDPLRSDSTLSGDRLKSPTVGSCIYVLENAHSATSVTNAPSRSTR